MFVSRKSFIYFGLVLSLIGMTLSLPCLADGETKSDCLLGSYRLQDGSALDIAQSVGTDLRWRKFDGTTGALHRQADGSWTGTSGWTGKSDGVVVSFDCGKKGIQFGGLAGARQDFGVRDVTFESHGVALAGRLVMPLGSDKVPVIILIHGSEPDSAIDSYSLQRMFPAEGAAVFVYDKRGTGRSKGKYTQDYSLLADDAVAAVATARSLAGARLGRIGFQGGSQGGWVVPLAASRTHVDFAIVCFGLAVNAVEEDQEAVELQLRERGYSQAQIRDAQEVARAAENVMESDMSAGFQELDSLRARYANAPWYKDLRGDYTWLILPKTEAELRAMAPDFDWHTPFHYDSMRVLRASRTPQLWILGGEDEDAPSAETRQRLTSLVSNGQDYTIAYYPNAEHGMTLFDVDPKHERISTRYAPGYFQMMLDYAARGRLGERYGDAQLTLPKVNRH
jgi:pimeloyl-ACP methyl ester carboxylesterase